MQIMLKQPKVALSKQSSKVEMTRSANENLITSARGLVLQNKNQKNTSVVLTTLPGTANTEYTSNRAAFPPHLVGSAAPKFWTCALASPESLGYLSCRGSLTAHANGEDGSTQSLPFHREQRRHHEGYGAYIAT